MIRYEVNAPEITIQMDLSSIFKNKEHNNLNPIDLFYNSCTELAQLTEPAMIDSNPSLSRLLLLGYVASVEQYLRGIFCECINVCPLCTENVSEKPIQFISVDYYDRDRLPESLFASTSFSSMKEIKNACSNILGLNIQPHSSFSEALEKFDEICHLRHCAVHNCGALSAYSAKRLNLDRTHVNRILLPDATQLQQALSLCFSFVRAFNQNIFDHVLKRWLDNGILVRRWEQDQPLFNAVLERFWSSCDLGPLPKQLENIYDTIFEIH